MGLKFKIGDEVQVTPKPIQGKVLKSSIVGDSIQVLVEYEDGEESHRRWFDEQTLAAVPAVEEPTT